MATGAPVQFHAHPPLPVDDAWTCHRTGDCCRQTQAITVSSQEADLLQGWADQHFTIGELGRLRWAPDRPGFVRLKAGPCPFLSEKGQCRVYEVRPYNCRRFACLRVDPKTEALHLIPNSPYFKDQTGCFNTRERVLGSRAARRLYERIQRHAQRWARAHGWTE